MSVRPLAIRGGLVVDPRRGEARALDLLVRGDRIEDAVPPGSALPAECAVMDAGRQLLVPGLVNAHTHAHGALGRGMVPDCTNLEMFLSFNPALCRDRTLELHYLGAALSAAEMVRNGCTAAYDLVLELPLPTPEGLHAVARAYRDVGMRAVVAPMIADRTLLEAMPALRSALGDAAGAPGLASAAEVLAACRRAMASWPFPRDEVGPALGPTIPLHCSDELLAGCGRLSAELDVGLHTHLLESRLQRDFGRERFGDGLIARLAELGVLGPRSVAAHCIWLDDADISRLADTGACVAHNPLSNLRMGSGLAPLRAMLDAGLEVAVGTDATNTSDCHNVLEATRLSAYLSRPLEADPGRWVSSAQALAMATLGGARALGAAGTLGRLERGYKADIVFLSLDDLLYVPLRNAVLQLVNGESGRAIRRVMVGGRSVLENGRLLTLDEAKLRDAARDAGEEIDRATLDARQRALRDCRLIGAFCAAHACQASEPQRALP